MKVFTPAQPATKTANTAEASVNLQAEVFDLESLI